MSNKVAIYNADDFSQIFGSDGFMSLSINKGSKLTKFQVEDGTQKTDHRVINPTEITINFLITDSTQNLYERINTAYLNLTPLIVQTLSTSYDNMYITEMPNDESPASGQATPLTIKLQEVSTVTPEYGDIPPASVASDTDSSTVNRGSQQTVTTPTSTASAANDSVEIMESTGSVLASIFS